MTSNWSVLMEESVKGLSWEYDIFSRTCDCSRVVSGGQYFRFGFGFGTVFSFR